MEYLLVTLIILLIISLIYRPKNKDISDLHFIRIKNDIDLVYKAINDHINSIDNHQKIMGEVVESINLLNAHFIMSDAELSKNFPDVHNKVHLKPKLTLVKLKKEIDKITKKKRKKESKDDERNNWKRT